MNEFLMLAVALGILIVIMCKCTEMACQKVGPPSIVDRDHAVDPFMDFDNSHVEMGPFGYLKGPVVHRMNPRRRPLP